jgi:hypothetical protein
MNARETASTTRFLPVHGVAQGWCGYDNLLRISCRLSNFFDSFFSKSKRRRLKVYKVYTVYQIDSITRVREIVGFVLERRKLDRGNNFENLLKLARKIYPPPSPDVFISLE